MSFFPFLVAVLGARKRDNAKYMRLTRGETWIMVLLAGGLAVAIFLAFLLAMQVSA